MAPARAFAYADPAAEAPFIQAAAVVTPISKFGQKRLIVSEPVREWRDEVTARLTELCGLPLGWNGYRAPPVSFEAANFALRMLEVVCATDAPAPQIVPGPNGDLQLEWHLLGGSLEAHVRAPYVVEAWRGADRLEDDGEEIGLTSDFTVLAKWIRDLVESTRAAEAAAA